MHAVLSILFVVALASPAAAQAPPLPVVEPPPPAAAQTNEAPQSGTLSALRPFDVESFACPRDMLKALLETATEHAEAVAALGIEREALKLCRERQETVLAVLALEAQLQETLAPAPAPTPVTDVVVPVAPEAVPPPLPSYAWFSIIGSGDLLRAGITDGTKKWFVRAGDRLPGGVRITAIRARPPAVETAGTGALPYGAAP